MNTDNSKKPTTLIIHGANTVGDKLTSILSTQKSNVIILDEFTKENKKTIKELKSKYGISAYDLSAIPSLTEEIKRLDYVFILLDQYLVTHIDMTGKHFLSETNIIDALFKLSIEQGAKVMLTTSIATHRKIVTQTRQKIDSLKDPTDRGVYTPVELQRYCENLAAEYHDQALLDIRITRVGEVIGEGIPLESRSTLVQMVKESITKPRITIPGEGLDYTYYVHHFDAVYGIIKSLFSNKTNGEVFSLSYPEEISTLNLAYKILELNPRANEIFFSEAREDNRPQHTYVPAKNLSKIGWSPKISFEQALLETMEYFHKEYNVKWENKPTPKSVQERELKKEKVRPHRSESVTPFGSFLFVLATPFRGISGWTSNMWSGFQGKNVTRKTVVKYVVLGIIAIVLYVALIGPAIQLVVGVSGTYYFGKKGYREAYDMEAESAQSSLDQAGNFASLAQSGWYGLRWMGYIPPVDEFYNETAKIFSAAEHLTNGGYYLVLGFQPYAQYIQNFEPITSFGSSAGGGSREYLDELEAMEEHAPYIEMASVEISLARESLETLDTSAYPQFIAEYLEELTDKAVSAENSVQTLENFAYFVPELLGKDGRKTYVILFQNPMELRSTGGWLTSVAIVGIERGQVRQLEVEDVYNIDGQITETVMPPITMQQALDIDEWTLSLSNWSPDFPQSAEAAEYFLRLSETLAKADGVIAVDLEAVRDLIDVWGEIPVPGELDPVTKENLYDKVIEIHKEFTPGSTDKPVFLSNLSNEIIQKVLSSPRDSWSSIAEVLTVNLEEKHILVNIYNTQIREILDDNNWSGHIEPKRNILFPVEWNWGGNKANHFINRSTNLRVNIIDEFSVTQTLKVTFQNTSSVNRYPEGEYVNFVRVYLPPNSNISQATGLDDIKIRDDGATGLVEISGWITVPVKSKASYTFTYQLDPNDEYYFPITVGSNNIVTYTSNFIKQPGLQSDPFTTEVSYPGTWNPSELTNVNRELNALIQRTDLRTDRELILTWEK